VGQADEVQQIAVAADGALILRSAKDAPRFKLLRWELPDDPEKADLAQARPLLAHGDAVITDVDAARDALYIVRRQGVNATLWRLPNGVPEGSRDGPREPQPIDLPVQGTVSVRAASPQHDGVVLGLGSWTRAASDHLLMAAADAPPRLMPLKLAQPGAHDAPPGLVSREVMVPSHDGVLVPASIVHREGLKLDGTNPTLLYGYGAYGIFQAPAFGARLLAWFEQGGVYVIAHVRGGGVFGDAWHRGGHKTSKFNTWRDGIAVAEWLIREGYTSPARLAVQGGSAGGIFVGRAATERPDLFAAAISNVGVLDMVRSETRANGVANVPEYGTVAREDEFRALLRASSYHALAEGTRYPAFLLAHGVNDIRVDVWQSSKFAAKAQALKSQTRPVLMLLDFEAGHGSGSSRAQAQARLADQWAFLLWQFGVPGFQPQASGR
jgi:prolyl oligopeptidase